jgi:hypothetical protein
VNVAVIVGPGNTGTFSEPTTESGLGPLWTTVCIKDKTDVVADGSHWDKSSAEVYLGAGDGDHIIKFKLKNIESSNNGLSIISIKPLIRPSLTSAGTFAKHADVIYILRLMLSALKSAVNDACVALEINNDGLHVKYKPCTIIVDTHWGTQYGAPYSLMADFWRSCAEVLPPLPCDISLVLTSWPRQ